MVFHFSLSSLAAFWGWILGLKHGVHTFFSSTSCWFLGSIIGPETWGSIFFFHLLLFMSTHFPLPHLHFYHHSQSRISPHFLLSVLSPFAYSANLHHQLPPLAAGYNKLKHFYSNKVTHLETTTLLFWLFFGILSRLLDSAWEPIVALYLRINMVASYGLSSVPGSSELISGNQFAVAAYTSQRETQLSTGNNTLNAGHRVWMYKCQFGSLERLLTRRHDQRDWMYLDLEHVRGSLHSQQRCR